MSAGIDGRVLLARLRELGEVGRDARGRLVRLAASDADRAGRDLLARWLQGAGLEVAVDAIGNLFGIWQAGAGQPVMVGSHIDTVIDAGIYDGCYGVLAGLAVVEALRAEGLVPARPLAVAAFTNEEGVRFAPDMMGSLVHAGGLDLAEALASIGTDGTVLGEELRRIGYAGSMVPGTIRPAAYLELHVEQGPVLEQDAAAIGAVADLQGISWQRLRIEGRANHAGTTPMALRQDAGHAAARIVTGLRALAEGGTVATVGSLRLEPDAINVIPGAAVLTVDLRDPDEGRLAAAEAALSGLVAEVAAAEGVAITTERLARFQPVRFDPALVARIEQAAAKRGLPVRRMTSGAGHDAQMLARICPSAMIFVPSRDGISHNPAEYTAPEALVAGAEVLLDVVRGLLGADRGPG
ncbi:MAG TPA: Zn-dependent hydrolase [Geminicoccus sp.]|uniref:Zn-dependent hydrolase n=1 Tax=Geminicoccus sp. TaxID=2024832 RepID=UPI002C5DF175|nr:Zn-dependent hydrolase [Geminicoccus sp.]HWL69974.1 Zn-dependent hydrolase [Geminicoccus sp.]